MAMARPLRGDEQKGKYENLHAQVGPGMHQPRDHSRLWEYRYRKTTYVQPRANNLSPVCEVHIDVALRVVGEANS